jgi:hypothetical protein
MLSDGNEPLANASKVWYRLMFGGAQKTKSSGGNDGNDATTLSAVERQTENSRKGGTIWEAVRKADEMAFKRLIKEDPKSVDARGPVGECPIHMLYIYGTETHLNMARYLIAEFPHTITQIYNLPVSSSSPLVPCQRLVFPGVLRRECAAHRHHQGQCVDGGVAAERPTQSTLSAAATGRDGQWQFLSSVRLEA